MHLSELLASLPQSMAPAPSLGDPVITRVTADSRQVVPGSVYVAVRGTSADGHAYLEDAVRRGASLTIGENPPERVPPGVPYLHTPDSRRALGWLCAAFERHPSRGMLMIGVTGTSGKTTTTYLIESVLRAAGKKVGVIGTVNFRFEGEVIPSTHTTPGAPELQGLFAEMRSRGCEAVVMEVSSHALAQRRTAGTAFDVMVFNNLSPEHLDFHRDLEDYYQAKKLLFTEGVSDALAGGKAPRAVVHRDDEAGARLLGELQNRNPGFRDIWDFGAAADARVSGAGLRLGLDGVHGVAAGVRVDSALIGGFNRENVLGAVAAGLVLGLDPEAIARGIRGVPSVDGRMERVETATGIHVLVDYAHKPDALRKVLYTLRAIGEEAGWKGRLITVMGCGGDRDRGKRPVMGAIASELSDRVWVTSDNPRSEDPMEIIRQVTEGMRNASNWSVEPDRARAIHAAIGEARPGDLVLIAGKGHETYQIVKDPSGGGLMRIDFDDRQAAKESLGS